MAQWLELYNARSERVLSRQAPEGIEDVGIVTHKGVAYRYAGMKVGRLVFHEVAVLALDD